MNAITPFDFEGRAVRVVEDDAGLPWFVALDVCECLGVKNSRDALDRLDDDEKGVVTTDTLGGQQQVSAVNEPGLYSLTLTSRKPEAKRFKRWITHDVLPALRRTGSYSLSGGEAAEPAPPAMPLAPQHRADVLVSASRIFGAALRTARQVRMPAPKAMQAAYLYTLRQTGVDWQEALGVDLTGPADALLEDGGRSSGMRAADQFRSAWAEGRLGLPDIPVLSNDAYTAFLDWCGNTGRERVPQTVFVAAITGVGGMVKGRYRYRRPGEPGTRDPFSFLIPLHQQHPPIGKTMEAWLGECVQQWLAAIDDGAPHTE